jgi:hypothetical protein
VPRSTSLRIAEHGTVVKMLGHEMIYDPDDEMAASRPSCGRREAWAATKKNTATVRKRFRLRSLTVAARRLWFGDRLQSSGGSLCVARVQGHIAQGHHADKSFVTA